jgi:hypothetical protein
VHPQTFIVNQTMIIVFEYHSLICGINTGNTYRGIWQRAQKERTRYCGLGREGENVSGEKERAVWVLN